MSYTGNGPALVRLATIAHAPWYSVSAVYSVLVPLTGLNFSIVAKRSDGLSILANIPLSGPLTVADFGGTATRFSADHPTRTYITESHPYWARIFSQLRLSLSYKDRSADTRTTIDPDLRLSMLAFYNVLADAMTALSLGIGCFDQPTFETTFLLTWVP
jgi:hypothetical protein